MSASPASCSTASLPSSRRSSPAAPQPTEDTMTDYLKIDHVDKFFRRGDAVSEVLKEITLSITKGEYVSIIGHSGCGKSTLLNIVAGLLPATHGGVLLQGREVNSP